MAINKYKPPKDRPDQPDYYNVMNGRLQGILIGAIVVPPLIAVTGSRTTTLDRPARVRAACAAFRWRSPLAARSSRLFRPSRLPRLSRRSARRADHPRPRARPVASRTSRDGFPPNFPRKYVRAIFGFQGQWDAQRRGEKLLLPKHLLGQTQQNGSGKQVVQGPNNGQDCTNGKSTLL